MSTLFTKIINGDLPGRFVWADDQCVAFATIAPMTSGHMLVVPRTEVDRFTETPTDLLAHLATVAAIIGQAQERLWPDRRATVLIAGFEVPHLHVHVVSVRDESQLAFANARADTPADELDAATDSVRQALIELGHTQFVPPQMDSARR